MNDKGQFVGYWGPCGFGPLSVAFQCLDGAMLEAIELPGSFLRSQANAINNAGSVVGHWSNSGLRTAFVLQDGVLAELPIPRRANQAEPLAVNDANVIVGNWANTFTIPPIACYWQDGQVVSIGDAYPDVSSSAEDINERGEIAGYIGVPWIGAVPFRWQDGEFHMLEVPVGIESGIASAINDRGDVVGTLTWRIDGVKFDHVAMWINDQLIDLGTPVGYGNAWGKDVNDQRQIVVAAVVEIGASLEWFIWEHGSFRAMSSLAPTLDPPLQRLAAISDSGQILARNVSRDPVLLTPGYRPADFDHDCAVAVTDLLILLGDWGPTEESPADLDGDGTVGANDLVLLLGSWS